MAKNANIMGKMTARDITKNLLQYLSMIIITCLAVTLFCGFISNAFTLERLLSDYYQQTNLTDLIVQYSRIDDADREYLQNLAPDELEYRIYTEGSIGSQSAKVFIAGEDNKISLPLITKGRRGVLVDKSLHEKNGINPGDMLTVEVQMPIAGLSRITLNLYVTGIMTLPEAAAAHTSSPLYVDSRKFLDAFFESLPAAELRRVILEFLDEGLLDVRIFGMGIDSLLDYLSTSRIKSILKGLSNEQKAQIFDRACTQALIKTTDDSLRHRINEYYQNKVQHSGDLNTDGQYASYIITGEQDTLKHIDSTNQDGEKAVSYNDYKQSADNLSIGGQVKLKQNVNRLIQDGRKTINSNDSDQNAYCLNADGQSAYEQINSLNQKRQSTDYQNINSLNYGEQSANSLSEGAESNFIFVLDRDSMESVVMLDTEISQSLKMIYVFPVIFMLVSVLVILSTVGPLILKERTNIGTLKSIGISDGRILMHYALMGVVLCFIGGVIGAVIGPLIIPKVLLVKYGLVYSIPAPDRIVFSPLWSAAAVFFVCALAGLIGFLICRKTTREKPAECMRPLPPKASFLIRGIGKRKRAENTGVGTEFYNAESHNAGGVESYNGVDSSVYTRGETTLSYNTGGGTEIYNEESFDGMESSIYEGGETTLCGTGVVDSVGRLEVATTVGAAESHKLRNKKRKAKNGGRGISIKMAVRNILIKPSRAIMTIVGVAGCVALLACSFGIGDTVNNSVDFELGGQFWYDISTSYSTDAEDEFLAEMRNFVTKGRVDYFESYKTYYMSAKSGGVSATAESESPANGENAARIENLSGKKESADKDENLFASGISAATLENLYVNSGIAKKIGRLSASGESADKDENLFANGISAATLESQNKTKNESLSASNESASTKSGSAAAVERVKDIKVYALPRNPVLTSINPDGKTLITKSVAEDLGVKSGDLLTLSTAGSMQTVVIDEIIENSFTKGIFVTDRGQFKDGYHTLDMWIATAAGEDTQHLVRLINKINGTKSAFSMEEQRESVDNVISSIQTIRLTMMVFSIALAVVVLYNLSLLNIKERHRDLATMKVLGFSTGEISRSLLFEIMILVLVGTGIGLFLGYPVTVLVMSINRIEVLTFLYKIKPVSYVFSALLTLGTALLINLLFARPIAKINMTESLKSVE